MRHLKNVGLVLVFAGVHFGVYIKLFGTIWELGDAGRPVPWSVGVPAAVLGVPLMYLLMLPTPVLDRAVLWHGAFAVVYVLAGVNALLWGTAVLGLRRLWQRRRRGAGRSAR